MSDIDIFIRKFTDEKLNYEKVGKKYFMAGEEAKKTAESLQNFISSGLPVGESGEKFKPSIYLLEILSSKTNNKIFVNDKAEWLFLCGRDVLPESIVNDSSSADIFLVQNKRDENLGFGKKVSKGRTHFIKNIIDRGDFLRRERK